MCNAPRRITSLQRQVTLRCNQDTFGRLLRVYVTVLHIVNFTGCLHGEASSVAIINCHTSSSLLRRFLISQRSRRVSHTFGRRVGDDAEDGQHQEHRFDYTQHVVAEFAQIQFKTEYFSDGLNSQLHSRDEGKPELFIRETHFPVNHHSHLVLAMPRISDGCRPLHRSHRVRDIAPSSFQSRLSLPSSRIPVNYNDRIHDVTVLSAELVHHGQ